MSKTPNDLLRELARVAGYTDPEIDAYLVPSTPRGPFACTAVMTCMGRLNHLRHTLPLLLEHTPMHVIVVDWSCPDACGDWIEREVLDPSDRVSVIRCTGERVFNKCRALNVGLRQAVADGSPWLCVVDADTMIEPGWWPWVSQHLERGFFAFMQGHEARSELSGVLVMHSDDYTRTGGYDEHFAGWGCEDWDQRARLHFQGGLPFVDIPWQLARPISHSDALRAAHSAEDKQTSYKANYQRLSQNVSEWTGSELHELPQRLLRPLFGGRW